MAKSMTLIVKTYALSHLTPTPYTVKCFVIKTFISGYKMSLCPGKQPYRPTLH